MKALTSSAMFLLLAGLVTGASAQQINSPFRFVDESQSAGVWAGYMLADDGEVGLGPKGGPVFGVRYAIRVSGPFAIELEGGYFPTTRTVLDTTVVDSAFERVGEADMNMLLLNGSLRFNLTGPRTWHNIQPFFAFGAGAVLDLSGENGADGDVPADVRFDLGTRFAGQLGGGIEWFPTRQLTVRLDARNVLWKIETPEPFLFSRLGQETEADEWLQNGQFSLGLSLRF